MNTCQEMQICSLLRGPECNQRTRFLPLSDRSAARCFRSTELPVSRSLRSGATRTVSPIRFDRAVGDAGRPGRNRPPVVSDTGSGADPPSSPPQPGQLWASARISAISSSLSCSKALAIRTFSSRCERSEMPITAVETG